MGVVHASEALDCFVIFEMFRSCCCSGGAWDCFSDDAAMQQRCCDHLLSDCPKEEAALAEYHGRHGTLSAVKGVLSDSLAAPAGLVEYRGRGQPVCFAGHESREYTFERCCDESMGSEGDPTCWDDTMSFAWCCRPPAPVPRQAAAMCWLGSLRHWHELCCRGDSQHVVGPRGMTECWERAARLGEPSLSALDCCDFVPARGNGGGGGARCLVEGAATTCSYPGVAFRTPDMSDILVSRGQSVEVRERPPIFWSLAHPHPQVSALVAHLLTLGIGPYATAAEILQGEARALGIFNEVHAYTDFSFLSASEENLWRRHLDAWLHRQAKIAGFGWWKPVLCRHHLNRLPPSTGLLIFSDAGSRLEPVSAPSWRAALSVMRRFDVMAIVNTHFIEGRYTKRHTLQRFPLEDTGARDEGQFLTGLFILRRTPIVKDAGRRPAPGGVGAPCVRHRPCRRHARLGRGGRRLQAAPARAERVVATPQVRHPRPLRAVGGAGACERQRARAGNRRDV